MVPEYQFEHCVYPIAQDAMGTDPGMYAQDIYRKCADFLRLSTRPDVGITAIFSTNWVFVTIITNPYTHTQDGNPVYLDGLSFTGLVSLQTVSKTWPATAGLEDQTISIAGAFQKSTHITSITDEEFGGSVSASMI